MQREGKRWENGRGGGGEKEMFSSSGALEGSELFRAVAGIAWRPRLPPWWGQRVAPGPQAWECRSAPLHLDVRGAHFAPVTGRERKMLTLVTSVCFPQLKGPCWHMTWVCQLWTTQRCKSKHHLAESICQCHWFFGNKRRLMGRHLPFLCYWPTGTPGNKPDNLFLLLYCLHQAMCLTSGNEDMRWSLLIL